VLQPRRETSEIVIGKETLELDSSLSSAKGPEHFVCQWRRHVTSLDGRWRIPGHELVLRYRLRVAQPPRASDVCRDYERIQIEAPLAQYRPAALFDATDVSVTHLY
jgi:hypothetical protein